MNNELISTTPFRGCVELDETSCHPRCAYNTRVFSSRIIGFNNVNGSNTLWYAVAHPNKLLKTQWESSYCWPINDYHTRIDIDSDPITVYMPQGYQNRRTCSTLLRPWPNLTIDSAIEGSRNCNDNETVTKRRHDDVMIVKMGGTCPNTVVGFYHIITCLSDYFVIIFSFST